MLSLQSPGKSIYLVLSFTPSPPTGSQPSTRPNSCECAPVHPGLEKWEMKVGMEGYECSLALSGCYAFITVIS